jgi:hypothetical protein
MSVFRPKIKRNIRHDLSDSSCCRFGSQHEPEPTFDSTLLILRLFEGLNNPRLSLPASSSLLVFLISTAYLQPIRNKTCIPSISSFQRPALDIRGTVTEDSRIWRLGYTALWVGHGVIGQL